MQGLILAAGMGKRLNYLTKDNTKCMVEVNGVSMIERSLRILDKKKLTKIILVVGYKARNLKDFICDLQIETPIVYIENEVYDKTNNIYSLALAKEYLCKEDTLLLESDLVFEESIIDDILNDERNNLALVDKFESWMDGTCMELDEEDSIINFIPGKHLNFLEKEKYYKTVNIYKFSVEFSTRMYVPFLCAYEKAMGENEYYESVIKLIAMLETREIRAKRLTGQLWYEIDNIQDLKIAESLFTTSVEEKYKKLTSRYGGYWRYPRLLDFCYLVNPYYPPKRLCEEMKSNFETLLSEYPSGMDVNATLAAGAFAVQDSHIIVGNGAAELIKSLMNYIMVQTTGKIGCCVPTFEEYPNRLDPERVLKYTSSVEGYKYSAKDLIDFFDDKPVSAIVIINPDNPSGNYIPYHELLELVEWGSKKNIYIIVDESFVDFVDIDLNENKIKCVSMIDENVLMRSKMLVVVKSISKSYGVPGIRLGVLASSNQNMINELKQDVAIWNINSYGEFFLQIKEKYEKDYVEGLKKLQDARRMFIDGLKDFEFLKVYDSQANYVMCGLEGITSSELCYFLLERNVLIKDLTRKVNDTKEYVRIAVRSNEDNQRLLECLREFQKNWRQLR